MRQAAKIWLSSEQQDDLERFARSRTLAARLVQRAKIVLLAAAGKPNVEIAEALQITRQTAAVWRDRFAEQGFQGIGKDAPRSGRPRRYGVAKTDEIVEKTTQTKPANSTHWSTRSLAVATGVSASTVGRIWRVHGLKPHRMKTFKLSNDPRFAEKLEDIVSLYLDPPEDSLILSVDEKCQIQALQRTQPGLPWKKGRCGTMTHDYKRHGTTTLFAAMDVQQGTIIDVCMPRHRHQEWIKFLRLIDRQTDPAKQLHLIMDNYSAHKHPAVKRWLARHPRFHVHFTPTGSSWTNMVERFFRNLTENCVRRGVFHSVTELQAAIRNYVHGHNQNPKPCIWTARATDILEKVKRAWAKLKASGYVPKNGRFAALDSIDRTLAGEIGSPCIPSA